MAPETPHTSSRAVWAFAGRQHGVVTLDQLLAAGFSYEAVKHRVARERLHRVRRGVYAVGRPELTRHGEWMAAVLACGPEAVLSHASAAALWELLRDRAEAIEVSLPVHVDRKRS